MVLSPDPLIPGLPSRKPNMPTTKVKSTKTVSAAKSGLTAAVYNLKAEKVGDITLSPAVFGVEWQPNLVAQLVRTYLANERVAHAKVKDRGEVNGTTKKMYAQKGTGRARHSTSKVGIFVGGGSVHGPQGSQNYLLKVNKKTKKLVLNTILSRFAKEESLIVVDNFGDLAPKTKEAATFMGLMDKANQTLAKSKKIGIITSAANPNVVRAFRNIPRFSLIALNSLNAFELTKKNFLVCSKDAIESLNK